MQTDEHAIARLHGRFSITAHDGEDLTPRGMKSQGLLALLMTSTNGSRSRVWLQDKLWSDRGTDQGAASLRQALREIRQSFGAHSALLRADRRIVSLDLDRIDIAPPAVGDENEFLEGIDVRDPEFEDWLRARRAAGGPSLPLATHKNAPNLAMPAVYIRADSTLGTRSAILEQLFSDLVAKSLRELASVEVYRAMPRTVPAEMLLVSVQAFQTAAEKTGLRVSVEDVASQRHIWSEFAVGDTRPSPDIEELAFLRLNNKLCSVILERATSPLRRSNGSADANLLASLAIQQIFTMRRDDLREADRLLSKAYELDRRGLFLAWRTQLFAIQFVERFVSDVKILTEMADECAAYALEFEPNNSFVLSAVANARRVLDKNFVQSGELAQMSVQANSANPLAWWSLSAAKLYAGDAEAAHAMALNAHRLAKGSNFRSWSDFQLALTAAVTGRRADAVRFGETSHALAPSFRPPLRYLTAVYAMEGEREAAKRVVSKLTDLEGDFSVTRLVSDPDYPVSLMRNENLLDKERLLSLELE